MDDPNMHAYEEARPYRCIKPQCSNHCCDCNCAISQADDAAMLVVDLLDAFAVDGHGGPLEDGESALVDRARSWLAKRKPMEQLGLAVVDAIADDGCRNAAGGIYATRVHEFAMEVQRAFAQQNGLQVRGLAT